MNTYTIAHKHISKLRLWQASQRKHRLPYEYTMYPPTAYPTIIPSSTDSILISSRPYESYTHMSLY